MSELCEIVAWKVVTISSFHVRTRIWNVSSTWNVLKRPNVCRDFLLFQLLLKVSTTYCISPMYSAIAVWEKCMFSLLVFLMYEHPTLRKDMQEFKMLYRSGESRIVKIHDYECEWPLRLSNKIQGQWQTVKNIYTIYGKLLMFLIYNKQFQNGKKKYWHIQRNIVKDTDDSQKKQWK